MNRGTWVFIILVLFAGLIYSQDENISSSETISRYKHFEKIYQQAGKLSLSPSYDEKMEVLEMRMNQEALQGFMGLAPALEKNGNDSLAFQCYLKVGILYHYFDSLDDARAYYQKTIHVKKRSNTLTDSFI